MAPSTRARKNTTNINPRADMSPTYPDGIVDIKVLSKIHSCLSDSSQDDDLALAAWVKNNFLYEPTDVESRDIRTAEGFFNIERAWRRVRALTGKAVDKWPFCYSSWKKMPAPVVRKNAQGADASGVSMPAMANATRDSTMSKKQRDPQKNTRAPTPGADASGARSIRQTRRRAQSSEPPAAPAPATLPPVKKESKINPKRATTPGPGASVARSIRQTSSRARSSERPPVDVPPSLPAMKKESKDDTVPKLPTIAEAVEETIVDTSSTSASGKAPSKNQPAKPVRGYEPPWVEPPVVKTNLDKLPPKSLLAKKRKAEAASAAQEGPRPKRSRTQSSKTPVSGAPAPGAPTRISTRRTKRGTAARRCPTPEPSAPAQGKSTEVLQAPTLHGVNLNKFGKPTLLQPLVPTQAQGPGLLLDPVHAPITHGFVR